MSPGSFPTGAQHLEATSTALVGLAEELPRLQRWADVVVERLGTGARLLVAGNGGSAAQAQHLTAELVGRYVHDRQPLSALALHADTSTTTAIANDYGAEEVFARQVLAHGRSGDLLLLLSTSGRSPNVLAAADAGRLAGLDTWAFTGPTPNPLAAAVDDAVAVDAPFTATVQEMHLVCLHVLCAWVDVAIGSPVLAEVPAR